MFPFRDVFLSLIFSSWINLNFGFTTINWKPFYEVSILPSTSPCHAFLLNHIRQIMAKISCTLYTQVDLFLQPFIVIMFSSFCFKKTNSYNLYLCNRHLVNRNSIRLQNRRIFLRILGEQRRNRGEREMRVAWDGRNALPLARNSRFVLALLSPPFA